MYTMSQDFIIVDLDERVWLDCNSKTNDWSPSAGDLALETLRVPCTSEKVQNMLAGRFNHQREAPLMRLPPELLHEILDHLNPTGAYTPPIFLFAITCKLALTVARPHIARLQRRHFSPLAGHRLVCIANGSATLGDYAESLFTEDEKRALCGASDRAGDTPVYEMVGKSWRRCTHDPPSFFRPMDLIHRRSTVTRMCMRDFLAFRTLAEPFYPAGVQWVLQNLSRREYVFAAALKEVHEVQSGLQSIQPRNQVSCTALLALLCSPPCSPRMKDANSVEDTVVPPGSVEGRWAGDRLEVTPSSTVLLDNEEGPWKDLTEDVLAAIRVLYVPIADTS
ncbi:hypothetical protein OH77DRAFT_60930 [Trametes cingulata]|nr:hypothetical protein OH77DRAFT_60930 [Trametes cingulata]